jgi:hypothetical protein
LRDVAPCEGGPHADRDLPCFPLSPDDSSRNVKAERAHADERAPDAPTTTASPPDIEGALARALDAAAAAGRFDVVAQLARELEARRLAHSPNVVRLDDGRERKR